MSQFHFNKPKDESQQIFRVEIDVLFAKGYAYLPHSLKDLVKVRKMLPVDFFIFSWFLANEFRGNVETGFSRIAKELGLKPETVRQSCKRLKAIGLIDFEMKQGRKSNTKFKLMTNLYIAKEYKIKSNEKLEVQKEVNKEVTSNQENSQANVTIESSSSHQGAALPNQEVPNNKDNNKKYIINSLNEILKFPLKDKYLQSFNSDFEKLGIEIFNKAIASALKSRKEMHNYSYFKKVILEKVEELVKKENHRRQLEEEKRKKIEQDLKNADSFEEGLKQIKKMKINLGYIKPDEEKKNG